MLVVLHPFTIRNDKDTLIEQFKQEGATIYETTGQDDTQNIRKLLHNLKPKKVVVIGGDGTVHVVAQLLIGTATPLAIFPGGSTNALFNELTTQEQPLHKRKIIAIDTIKIGTRYCLHLADFGLNAQIIKESKKNAFSGFFRYIVSFFSSLFHFKKHTYVVNGKKIRALLLAIANGTKYGAFVQLNPQGDMTDGVFEVCTPKKQRSYKRVTIENKTKSAFHIDGEFIGHPKKIVAEIEPQSLHLLI